MVHDESISTVFQSLRSSLAKVVRRIAPLPEVEDIVQETYVRVCLAERQCEIRSPRSFMFETARNLARDHVKRAESRLVDGVETEEEFSSRQIGILPDQTLNSVSAEEEFALFCSAVRDLPVQCRRAFVLRKVYGYTQREIAQAMKLSEKTVEKHIASGLRRCMAFMETKTQAQQASGVQSPTRVGSGQKGGCI